MYLYFSHMQRVARQMAAVQSTRRWLWTLHDAAVYRPIDKLRVDMERQAQRETEWDLDFALLPPPDAVSTSSEILRCCCAVVLTAASSVERLSVTIPSAAVGDALAAVFRTARAESLRVLHLTLYDVAFLRDDAALAMFLQSVAGLSSRLESLHVTVVMCDMQRELQWRHKAVTALANNIHPSVIRVLSLEHVNMQGASDEELNIFFHHLASCHGLSHLSLRGARGLFLRVPLFCAAIGGMRRLEVADFSSALLSDALMDQLLAALRASIGGWHRLRHLNLAETNVSVWCLQRMLRDVGELSPGETASIEMLNLNSNGMDDEGAFVLASCCMRCEKLRELHLRHNRLTKKSATTLGSALITAASLRCLNLHSNQFGDEGLERLLQYAKYWPELCHLDVTRCRLTARCLSALSEALPFFDKLEELTLDRNDLRPIETPPTSSTGDAAEGELQLFVYDSCFMQRGGRGDRKVPTSFELDRRDALDGRRRFKGTEACRTSLPAFESTGGVAAFERLGAALSGCRELRRLSLSSCSLTDASFTALAGALVVRRLTHFNLSANPLFTRMESLEALARLLCRASTSLQALDLSCTGLGCVGVSLLLDGTSAIATSHTGDVFALRSLTALTQLRLSNCRIGADGFDALTESLPAIASLEQVFLDGNVVDDVSPVVSLLEALVALPSLRFIGLHGSVPRHGVATVTASRGCAALRSKGVIVHF